MNRNFELPPQITLGFDDKNNSDDPVVSKKMLPKPEVVVPHVVQVFSTRPLEALPAQSMSIPVGEVTSVPSAAIDRKGQAGKEIRAE